MTSHMRKKLPDGDILIHAGDFTRCGHLSEVREFNAWLKSQPHKHKIVIAGNHELSFDQSFHCKQVTQLLLISHSHFVVLNGVILHPMSTKTLLRANCLTPIQLSIMSECYFYIQTWSLAMLNGFNTPYHLKCHNSICIFKDAGLPSNI